MVFIPDDPEEQAPEDESELGDLVDRWDLTRVFLQRWAELSGIALSVTCQEKVLREVFRHLPAWLEEHK